MHPKLFEIPFINWPVGTYGPMLVIGFLAAITLIRYLSKRYQTDPQHITNAALYSLIGGVVGARAFYVIHYFDSYRDNLFDIFKVWKGGLELLGGVIAAIAVILIYLIYHKLPIRRYLDILAIGLMTALVFGRIGCFLNGCCFGKPTDFPLAVRFPYHSYAYYNQVNPNPERNRSEPHLKLPDEYFYYITEQGYGELKPFNQLSSQQQLEVLKGKYRCLPVHPTQLYSSVSAAVVCLILLLFWKRAEKNPGKFVTQPGSTFSLMFILYGIMRFNIEFLRDDNPFEYAWWAIYKGGTVSQNISIYMIILGIILIVLFNAAKYKKLKA
jgi:phosphatidylglycerol:prolipoprotein diacylglycerol transferase